jgi:hypothetical protein
MNCFSPTSSLGKINIKETFQKPKKQKKPKNEMCKALKFMRNLSIKFETHGLENPSFIKVTVKNETYQYGKVIFNLFKTLGFIPESLAKHTTNETNFQKNFLNRFSNQTRIKKFLKFSSWFRNNTFK